MGDGLDRQLTDRELAWTGIGLGARFVIAGVVVCADGRWDGLLILGAGVACLVLGWGRRKDRHNPDELPRYTYARLGKWTRDALRWLRRKIR